MKRQLITIGDCLTCTRSTRCEDARDGIADCLNHTTSTDLCSRCRHDSCCNVKQAIGSPVILCPDQVIETRYNYIPTKS